MKTSKPIGPVVLGRSLKLDSRLIIFSSVGSDGVQCLGHFNLCGHQIFIINSKIKSAEGFHPLHIQIWPQCGWHWPAGIMCFNEIKYKSSRKIKVDFSPLLDQTSERKGKLYISYLCVLFMQNIICIPTLKKQLFLSVQKKSIASPSYFQLVLNSSLKVSS